MEIVGLFKVLGDGKQRRGATAPPAGVLMPFILKEVMFSLLALEIFSGRSGSSKGWISENVEEFLLSF